jgi:hypothetical protein
LKRRAICLKTLTYISIAVQYARFTQGAPLTLREAFNLQAAGGTRFAFTIPLLLHPSNPRHLFYGYNTHMEFFLPEDNLTRALPEETRITALSAQPYPDGRRVRVNLEVTPFQKRPHIEVVLENSNGDEVASTSLVEPLSWKLEFTMHLRGELNNPYTVHARLYYPDGPAAEPRTFSFNVTAPDPEPDLN